MKEQNLQGINFPEKEEYLEQAVQANCSMLPVNLLIGGSVFIGVSVAYAMTPPIGAVSGFASLLSALRLAGKIGDREDLIRKHKLIAPFLSDRRAMLEYSDLVGYDQVRWECSRARQMGEKISPAAQNYLKFGISQTQPQNNGYKPQPQSEIGGSEPTNEQNNNGYQLQSLPGDSGNDHNLEQQDNDGGLEQVAASEETNPFEPNYITALPFKIFYGAMGSGKTTAASTAIEYHYQRGDFVLVINPFNKASEWLGIPVAGRAETEDQAYEDTEAGISWVNSLMKGRAEMQRKSKDYKASEKKHVVVILEEVLTWGMYVDSEIMREFWKRCLQGLRQLNCSVILTSQNITSDGLGGQKATERLMESIMNQADLFKLEAKPNPDRSIGVSPMIPSGKCYYKPSNYSSKKKENFYHIAVPSEFKPSNFDLDFRDITGKGDYPNWRREVNLEDKN